MSAALLLHIRIVVLVYEFVNMLIQEVKTGPFMDFEVKKNMRVAALCRVPGLDVVNMIKCLDEQLVRQVVNDLPPV